MEKIINFFKTNVGFLVLITIIVFLLYGKSINYQLLDLDDQKSINENIEFISDYKNIPKLFLKDCYCENVHTYYRPILIISFAVTAVFFKELPAPYHISNIILFILSFYLMYLLLLKLNFNKDILQLVLFSFLVHPIFTSNVVYVSPRAEMLLIIFYSLSIINLICFLQENKKFNLVLVIIFFLFAVFTKETGLMLLPIYAAVIYCFNLKISKKQIIVLSCCLIISTLFYFYLRNLSVSKLTLEFNISNFNIYINNIFTGLLLYTYKIFIPGNIAIILGKINITGTYIVFNILVYLLLIYMFYKKLTNRKVVSFGVIWFVLMLFPTFFISDYQFFFHRIFTAFLGVIIILVSITDFMIKKYPVTKKYLLILFSILFITYFFAAYKQADKYKDSDTFWQNAYLDAPDMPIVLASIGKIYSKYGDYKKGYEYFKKAVNNDRTLSKYSKYLAFILLKTKNIAASERMMKYSSKGDNYHYIMSLICYEKKQLQKASIYANIEYQIKPYQNNLLMLSKLYSYDGCYELSKEMLLKIKNKTDDNYYVLAMLYDDLNDKENAIKCIKKAIELKPDNEKYVNLLQKLKLK